MKRKIVLWGHDESDKKILVALELKEKENKVCIHTFPEEIATEVFYNEMMENWRADKETPFPDGHVTIEKPLSVTDTLLPESIKVGRADVINRASTEWHFMVLSNKLYEMYKSELEEKTEKLKGLTTFDNGLWNEMKTFWNKVQEQVFGKNLLRSHADTLKEGTNSIFDKLKELKKSVDKEFEELSAKNKEIFETKLTDVEAKIEKGLGLKPLFEDLKRIQSDFKNAKFTRDHRNKLWKRIDESFKKVKDKRFSNSGNGGGDNSAVGRLTRRYEGLLSAIEKMERTINRDIKDIEYQKHRIEHTDGQLEKQISEVKLKMINERFESKNEKLQDMLKTKAELENKIAKEKKKAEVEAAKAEAKEKIASQIEDKGKEISAEEKAKIASAAQELKENKKPTKAEENIADGEKPIAEEVKNTEVPKAEETVEAEAKPVEQIVPVELPSEDVVEEKVEEVKEVVEEAVADKVEEVKADSQEESKVGFIEGITDSISNAIEDVVDTAKAIAVVASEKIEDAVESVSDKIGDAEEE